MILNLVIEAENKGDNLLPFNYHYPLSAAIYNIIEKGSAEFASFLHDTGYGVKKFKLFTFSDIRIPFACRGDRMFLRERKGVLKVCFHVPEAASHFVKGLFMKEKLVIGDTNSRVHFKIQSVENHFTTLPLPNDNMITLLVEPISPLLVGSRRREDSNYRFYSPYELPFTEWLLFSWIEKFKVVYSKNEMVLQEIKKNTKIEIIFCDRPPNERRIIIKNGRDDAQKIRGYTRFKIKITSTKEMVELALNSGLGLKNSLGMGCVQLIH